MQMNNWNGRIAACTVWALFATSTYSFPASLSAQQPDATSPAVTFRKIMSAPAEFDDNFTYAVIAVSAEHKSLIARNYIRVGSGEQIRWLRDHPRGRAPLPDHAARD